MHGCCFREDSLLWIFEKNVSLAAEKRNVAESVAFSHLRQTAELIYILPLLQIFVKSASHIFVCIAGLCDLWSGAGGLMSCGCREPVAQDRCGNLFPLDGGAQCQSPQMRKASSRVRRSSRAR